MNVYRVTQGVLYPCTTCSMYVWYAIGKCWCWQSAVGSVGRGSWQLAVAVLAVLACVQYLPAVIHGFRSGLFGCAAGMSTC